MFAQSSGVLGSLLLANTFTDWLTSSWLVLEVVIGFSIIIFVHELGHFLAAKWMGVRVDRFSIGFGYRLCGYRRGEGFSFGHREHTAEELVARGYGETDYCFKALPFGGYVKMLGQDDIQINEETGEIKTSTDPRAFTNKPVGKRMVVVSAGVVFNVLFALIVYAVVFLALGRNMMAPVLGDILPGSNEAKAGLLPGDRIKSIDGSPVVSLDDVAMGWLLADKTVRVRVERGGHVLDKDIVVEVTRHDGDLERGIGPMAKNEVADTSHGDFVATPSPLQPHDRITQVNGIRVSNGLEITVAIQRCGGRDVQLTVERLAKSSDAQPEILTISVPPHLLIGPTDLDATGAKQIDSANLLGFIRRQAVDHIFKGNAAQRAGFKEGDVITQWGSVVNPLYDDIKPDIDANKGEPISVVVERGGQFVPLTVTPRSEFRFFGSAPPRVGIVFTQEEDRAVVADVAPGTPAAALGMPRGSELTAIDDVPVHTWSQVYEALFARSDRSVTVHYKSGSEELSGTLAVPSSIVTELHLPPTAAITRIDGQDHVKLDSGKTYTLPTPIAVRELLKRNIGRTVSVDYVTDLLFTSSETATFTVRPDNFDPWPLRVQYAYTSLALMQLTELVKVPGQPLRALGMACDSTYRVLVQVYRAVKSIATQHVGVQHLSGPIGIVRVAYSEAKAGWGDLLFFLAFLSINLAVLNFMPMPVVDGGLMVFLILEKFRGKPMSIKVQVITTLTGLALIILCGLFVTIQDVAKWLGGT